MYTYPYMCDFIAYLQAQVAKLKEENRALKKETSKTVHIERMEYKIHELNVSTLSGTMNLGVTAQADEDTVTDIVNQLRKTGNFNVIVGDNEKPIEPPSEGNITPSVEVHESTTTL